MSVIALFCVRLAGSKSHGQSALGADWWGQLWRFVVCLFFARFGLGVVGLYAHNLTMINKNGDYYSIDLNFLLKFA